MKPTLCAAGKQLREQFDDTYPDRDRTSDGWIADARHMSAGTSDHIPSPESGIVHAIDVDRDVSGTAKPDLMPNIADQLRVLAKTDKRIKYIIFVTCLMEKTMKYYNIIIFKKFIIIRNIK